MLFYKGINVKRLMIFLTAIVVFGSILYFVPGNVEGKVLIMALVFLCFWIASGGLRR